VFPGELKDSEKDFDGTYRAADGMNALQHIMDAPIKVMTWKCLMIMCIIVVLAFKIAGAFRIARC